MTWFLLTLFIFLTHLNAVQAVAKYDIDDDEGIAAIFLLVMACIVCLISTIVFLYIVYKLWNGLFGRRYYRSTSKQLIVHNDYDERDGSRYSSLTTVRAQTSSVNQSVVEETAKEEHESGIVENVVREEGITTEEVLVTHAPSTDQAQTETQELVIVFDSNDDVVDVFTHVT